MSSVIKNPGSFLSGFILDFLEQFAPKNLKPEQFAPKNLKPEQFAPKNPITKLNIFFLFKNNYVVL